MSRIYPTRTRLALLRSIGEGNVTGEVGRDQIWEVGHIVTSRVREMWHAGWCEPVIGPVFEAWTVTDAGHAVLASADCEATP